MTKHPMLQCAMVAATVLWLLPQPTPAQASRVLKYDIQQARSFVITAYSDQDTVLAFPGAVKYAFVKDMKRTPAHVDFVPHSHEVKLVPKEKSTPGGGVITIITETHHITVLLNIVDRAATEAYDRVEFYDGHAERKFLEEQCERRFKSTFAHLSFKGFRETHVRHDPGESDGIELIDLRVVQLADHHQFLFSIANHHHAMLPIQTLRLLDSSRREHTEFIEIDATSSDPNLIAELPRGDTATVFLEVDDLEHLGPTAYLEIVTTGGVPLATKTIYPFGDPYKVDPPNKDRIAIRAYGVGGALQLTDGLGGTDADWTTEAGLGARVAYGLTAHLTLEADLAVMRSGLARFENITWDDITGDLERRTTTVRTLAGVVLHTGAPSQRSRQRLPAEQPRFIPFGRLAIGPRFFIDKRAMTSGAKSDSSFDASLEASLAVGFEIWVGQSFNFGIAGEYGTGFYDGAPQALQGRLQLGYAFKR